MPDLGRRKLFTTTRASRASMGLVPESRVRAVRMLEEAWAERMGIANAPFRKLRASQGIGTDFDTPIPDRGTVKRDHQSADDLPDSVYATETHNGGDQVRDRQSPD